MRALFTSEIYTIPHRPQPYIATRFKLRHLRLDDGNVAVALLSELLFREPLPAMDRKRTRRQLVSVAQVRSHATHKVEHLHLVGDLAIVSRSLSEKVLTYCKDRLFVHL